MRRGPDAHCLAEVVGCGCFCWFFRNMYVCKGRTGVLQPKKEITGFRTEACWRGPVWGAEGPGGPGVPCLGPPSRMRRPELAAPSLSKGLLPGAGPGLGRKSTGVGAKL